MSVYSIEAASLTEAVAKLVQLVKLYDPSLGTFQATCHDGSKVTIRLAKNTKPVLRQKP